VSKVTAMVSITERRGRDSADSEIPVSSLDDLYEACRRAAPGALVRVVVYGPAGEVRLEFGSFIHTRH
jgi:uncharacterized iron-regulated membrane protein